MRDYGHEPGGAVSDLPWDMTELGVQRHEDGVKNANGAVVDDLLHFIPGFGFVEGAVDTARGLYSGMTGDNEAAAKHMYDAAMDVGPSFGGLNPIANAAQLAYDINAADDRKAGAMPAQAPTFSETVWNWMTDDPPAPAWNAGAAAAAAPSASPVPAQPAQDDDAAPGPLDYYAD